MVLQLHEWNFSVLELIIITMVVGIIASLVIYDLYQFIKDYLNERK